MTNTTYRFFKMGVNQSNSLHSSLHRKSILSLFFQLVKRYFYMLVNLCISKLYNRPTVTFPIHLATLTFISQTRTWQNQRTHNTIVFKYKNWNDVLLKLLFELKAEKYVRSMCEVGSGNSHLVIGLLSHLSKTYGQSSEK